MIAAGRGFLFFCILGMAAAASQASAAPPTTHSAPLPVEMGARGDEERAAGKYEEMLAKMQAAVEEIAQLYGNPLFLQVFTNDEDKAAELKQRLAAAGRETALRHDLADLEKKREDLLGDVALREKESRRLTEKLVRQRAALDALASALDRARMAAEESAK